MEHETHKKKPVGELKAETESTKSSLGGSRFKSVLDSAIGFGLHWQYSLLMVVLLIFTVLIPLGDVISLKGLNIIFSVVVLMSVLVAGRHRPWVLIGLILIFPPLILASITGLDESTPLALYNIYFFFLALFMLISIVSILQDVLGSHLINVHSISGAISVYLLIALIWTIGYTLIELNWPGSFEAPVSSASWLNVGVSSTATFATLFFYSIVTITTAGYGDVTAISPYARSLTSLELVTGQVFLAVLVAWLVGMYISNSIEDKNSTD